MRITTKNNNNNNNIIVDNQIDSMNLLQWCWISNSLMMDICWMYHWYFYIGNQLLLLHWLFVVQYDLRTQYNNICSNQLTMIIFVIVYFVFCHCDAGMEREK